MKKHLLAACSLAAVASLSALAPMSANAASDELQDGISVRIASDKTDYNVGEEVNLNVTIANTNAFDVNDVDVKLLLPDELEFKLNETPEEKISLKAGEKIGISAIAIKSAETTSEATSEAASETATEAVSETSASTETSAASTEQSSSSTSAAAANDENSPKTGAKGVSGAAVTLVLSASLALYLGKKGKLNKKTFSFILSLMLISSSMPYEAFVHAAEEDGLISNSINVDTTITSESKSLNISAEVSYAFEKAEIEKAAADTDGDGISDTDEAALGTDPTKADTDGDGLTDGFEVKKLGSNPLKADSDDNSVSDFDEDEDGDGLSNGKEQELGTNPRKADTDGDSLSDGEEVNTHGTDPTKADTDGDGIIDPDELKLSLDPTKASTDGTTPDGEKKIAQVTSTKAMSETLAESDNVFKPSVSGSVSGLIDRKVNLEKNETTSFADNRSVLSDVIDFTSKDHEPVTLTFTYDASVSGDTSNLAIFCFDNEELKVLDTKVDKDKHTLSAEVTDDAYYFVTDLDEFLKGFGIDPMADVEAASLPSSEATVKAAEEAEIDVDAPNYQAPAPVDFEELKNAAGIDTVAAPTYPSDASAFGQSDIVFVIDTTGSMGSAISNVKSNVNKFAETLKNDYKVNVNFSLIEYRDITCDGNNSTKQHKYLSSNWFTNADKFKAEINALSVNGGGDAPETPIDALELARKSNWRKGSTKYVVLVTDINYKNDNISGIKDMDEMTKKLAADGIIVSAISSSESYYKNLVSSTGGLYGNIYGNFSDILLGIAKKVGEDTNEGGDWVLLDDYSVVQLKDKIDKISSTDSDDDGLTDAYELGTKKEVDLTSLIRALYISKGVDPDLYKGKTTTTMWKTRSNPVLPDTDFDGIDDKKDSSPKPNAARTNNLFKGYYHWKQGKDYRKTEEKVELKMDYRNLLSNNTTYKKDLSVFSILGASDAYNNTYVEWTNGITGGSDTPGDLLTRFGCKDVKDYDIISTNGKDTDDVTEIIIGHRKVVTVSGAKEVVIVEVRGTNGTNSEWSSNFDVGADTTDYTTLTGSHPEWTNKSNHKGFDVAANRAQVKIETYLRTYGISNGSILICGHSRGAAIADILGAKFENNANFLSYTYAFATPNCTTDSNSTSYSTIFNVVNEDDLVPTLPLTYWGFHKYGTTRSISVEDNYEDSNPFTDKTNSWEWFTDHDYDSIDSDVFSDTLSSFRNIASNRNELYVFNNSDSDAKVWEDNLGHVTYSGAQTELNTLTSELKNEKLYKYCRLSIVGSWVYHVEVFYCPAYFMQVLANMTTKVGPKLGRDVKGKYATAKTNFVLASGKIPAVGGVTGGMQDTHEPLTYYVIAHNNFQPI